MKFLCLAYEAEQVFHDMPEEEWQQLRQETLDYVENLKTRGVLLTAQPLKSATTARTVRVRDRKVTVLDGPFAETKEHIGGFFLIEAADADEAAAIAAQWPGARYGIIEVRPVEEGLPTKGRY